MDKNSVLYLLVSVRMNGVMNDITEQDRNYQALLQEVDKHPVKQLFPIKKAIHSINESAWLLFK